MPYPAAFSGLQLPGFNRPGRGRTKKRTPLLAERALAAVEGMGRHLPGTQIARTSPPGMGATDEVMMANGIDLHVGQRLRRRRRLLGLTQQQLADAIGVRFQQIQKYECGANRMTAGRLYELSRALDIGVQYFFDGIPVAEDVGPATGMRALRAIGGIGKWSH